MAREAEFISRAVELDAVTQATGLVNAEVFVAFSEVWQYIAEYHAQFKRAPNKVTLLEVFAEFPWEDSEHHLEWIADELLQDLIERRTAAVLQEVQDALAINPRESVKLLVSKTSEVLLPYIGSSVAERVDLRVTSQDRYDKITKLERRNGLSGITHGFALLDQVTNGTQRGEIEMLFARPGEGKTTVMLYGAYRAWVEQEAVVSFISPEMNAMEIGLKFDSFAFNISASELLSGTTSVTELARYESEIHSWLRQEQSGFFFYDTETFGRSFTTGDLAAIIRRDKPDVLCVDGLLFLEPVRRDFKDLRTRLSYVIAELKTLVLTTGVPMRIAHQANRQAVVTQRRTKAITVDELLPDIQHLAESDATGQFANRAFAIKSVRGRTFIGIRKNRNGPKDKFISCSIDPDRGVVDQVRYEMQSTQIEDLEDADAAVPRERPELPF